MDDLAEDPRWRHLAHARWFAGKGRGGRLVSVQDLDWIVDPGTPFPTGATPLGVRSELCTVGYPDGSHEYYQLLVSYRRERLEGCFLGKAADPKLGYAHVATQDPQALRLLTQALLRPTPDRANWWARIQRPLVLADNWTVRVFRGEQSNTNIYLGAQAMLKIFRRLEVGHNLEVLVMDALQRTHVQHVPRLIGWVSAPVRLADNTSATVDLAMLSEQLKGASGWELACASAAAGSDFAQQSAALGRALARVHAGLAQVFPTERLDGAAVAARMTARLDAAVRVAPQLAPHQASLQAVFNRLADRALPAQRAHGDFHLGQTIQTAEGWKIIDFEGEPMQTLAERGVPDSVWRDVAGMVRSLAYASAGQADSRPNKPAGSWLQSAQEAFLRAYAGGAPQLARTPEILAAYVADKAVYEVVYETRNRPTWVDIPMAAIQSATGINMKEG